MTDTETHAPPALFPSVNMTGGISIVDAEGTTLYEFDSDAIAPVALAAVELMNVTLADPSAMKMILFYWDGDHELGRSTGGYHQALLEAIARADDSHMAKLALGYPALVAAVRVWQRVPGSPELFRTAIRDSWVVA